MGINITQLGTQDTNNYVNDSLINDKSVQSNDIIQNTPSNELVTVKDAQKAIDKLNKLLEDSSTHIEYEQDNTFKYVMIMRVVDNNTKQIIKEIPSKKILDMVAQFCEMAGFVLDKKA
jgi:Uncharacterized flagellar protein FlaG